MKKPKPVCLKGAQNIVNMEVYCIFTHIYIFLFCLGLSKSKVGITYTGNSVSMKCKL